MMDRKLVKEFRERWQAVAAVENEEQEAASVGLRWQQLNAIVQLALELGIFPVERAEEAAVRERWMKLKEAQP